MGRTMQQQLQALALPLALLHSHFANLRECEAEGGVAIVDAEVNGDFRMHSLY